MSERPYELISTSDGLIARIRARGNDVLRTPTLNRGTAFTRDERRALGLVGLLPTGVSSMEAQARRTYGQYASQPDALAKHLYLASLRDRNEVLFYRLLADHLEEMLPVVYTPTIGEAIERFSHDYNRPPASSSPSTIPGTSRPPWPATGWAPTTATSSWPPTPKASWASATRVSAASRSPSAS